MASKALTPQQPQNNNVLDLARVPVLTQDLSGVQEVVKTNLGNRRLTSRDLDKIRIPTGGNTTWQRPTLFGLQAQETIPAVIIGVGTPRVLWLTEFGKSDGMPPDCRSEDGVYGDGLYGRGGPNEAEGGRTGSKAGECITCPMNRWPARGEANRKKPCAELRNLFILPLDEEMVLPQVIICPPGSLQAVDEFLIRLSGRALPMYGLSVNIGLQQSVNKGGIKYAQIKLSALQPMDADGRARARAYHEMLTPFFGAVDVERADMFADEGTPDGDVTAV
jgi:hypothetical protein